MINCKKIIKYLVYAVVVYLLLTFVPKNKLSMEDKLVILAITVVSGFIVDFIRPRKEGFANNATSLYYTSGNTNIAHDPPNVTPSLSSTNERFNTPSNHSSVSSQKILDYLLSNDVVKQMILNNDDLRNIIDDPDISSYSKISTIYKNVNNLSGEQQQEIAQHVNGNKSNTSSHNILNNLLQNNVVKNVINNNSNLQSEINNSSISSYDKVASIYGALTDEPEDVQYQASSEILQQQQVAQQQVAQQQVAQQVAQQQARQQEAQQQQ